MNYEKEKQVIKIPANQKQGNSTGEKKKTVLRVAAYCRVSTEQESQAGSYVRQVEHYREKIKKREDWALVGIYADEGISGTIKKKRDGFLQLLCDCEAGKIDLILTKSISRFARNTVDLLTTIRDLKSKNIAVYFEKEHINTLESAGEILITILSSQAQEESRNISENIRWSLRRKYEKGELTISYNHFMGYTKDSQGKLKIVPEEAEVVRKIFHLYSIGYSSIQIAKYLKKNQIKTVMGKIEWQATVIDKMLCNEKYVGAALLQKTYTVDFLTKQRVKNQGELPKYFVDENHPAIISKDVFLHVQEEKMRHIYLYHQLQGRASIHPICGKMICGNCGKTYRKVTWQTEEGKIFVWRCKNRLLYGKKICKTADTIREKELHQAIWEAYSKAIKLSVLVDQKTEGAVWGIVQEMAVIRNEISILIWENVQGFWKRENLLQSYIEKMNRYYNLADQMMRLMLKRRHQEYIVAPFKFIGDYINYKNYEEEIVNLYVERIWVLKKNEIVVLFKNGTMIKQSW